MLPHALNWTINTQVIKFSEFNRGNKYWLLPYKDWVFNFCLSASTRCMAKSVASLIARQDVFLILILIKNQDSHWTDKWLVTSVSTDQIRDMWRPGRTWGRVTRDTWQGHVGTRPPSCCDTSPGSDGEITLRVWAGNWQRPRQHQQLAVSSPITNGPRQL